MAFELKQNLKLSQQLIMTPQLQQAIKLLQLSRLELVDTINQEMEENPLLEEVSPDEGNEEEVHAQVEDDVQSIEREDVDVKQMSVRRRLPAKETDVKNLTGITIWKIMDRLG